MTSPQFIDFIERKLRENSIAKVIPDETVLAEIYTGFEKGRRLKDAVRKLDKIDMSGFSAPKNLQRRVRQYLKQHPAVRWDVALRAIVVETRAATDPARSEATTEQVIAFEITKGGDHDLKNAGDTESTPCVSPEQNFIRTDPLQEAAADQIRFILS